MKATKIYYKKLFSLGNYQNEEIGIEIEIEPGERAADVLQKAKMFVNGLNPVNQAKINYEKSLAILENKDVYQYKLVKDAEEFVAKYNAEQAESDDLPF